MLFNNKTDQPYSNRIDHQEVFNVMFSIYMVSILYFVHLVLLIFYVVPGRVRVAVRLRTRNAEEMVADADFGDCVELLPEVILMQILLKFHAIMNF